MPELTVKEESVVAKLWTTDGKEYETRCYTRVGALRFIAKCSFPLLNEANQAA